MLLPSDEKISILSRKPPTQKVKVAYVLSGIAAVLIGLIIHVFVKGPQFEKLEDQAYFELKCSQFDKAHADFQELIQNNPTIVRHHYYYIQTFYFLSTAKQNTRYFDKIEADTLASFYEKIAQDSSNNQLKDIGNFGKGMLAYMENKNDEALHTLAAISNQNIAFLSFLRAKIYFNNHNLPEAIHFCRREILLHDNDHAYEMYLDILNDSKKISELDKFIHAYETSTKIPEVYKRKHYLRNKELVNYIWSIGKLFTEICSTKNLLLAIVTLLVWLIYLLKIDMFEQEKIIPIVATLLVEMSLYALLILFRDTFEVVFQFRSTGSFLQSLYVSCISYGLFEELVKIIPLLILIHFRKIINEPIDYVIYACVSALGFSFIENCIYLSNNNLLVDHSYSLINVVEHMFHTSIIAYGIVLAKFKRHKNPYLTTLFYLSISAFSHGFYSLFSTNDAFTIWKILSLFHFVIALLIWNTILNNCLNHSSFYDQKKIKDNTSIHSYLIYGLIGIGVLEYFINASNCGPQIANEMVFSSLKNGFFMIYLIGTNLSNFVHEKGVWSATKLIKESQPYNFDSVLDAKVSINMITRNNYLSTLLPNSGKINRRVNVTNEPDWYLVELDLVKNLELFETKTILIRTKNQSEIMKPEGTFIIAFYSIPKDYSFDSETIDRKVCSFRGWATLHFV